MQGAYANVDDTAPSPSRLRLGVATATLIAYAALVLLATMWPTPLDQGYEASIDRVLAVLHRNGVPDWFGYHKLEFLANIVMFIPIGFLVATLLPLKLWWLSLVICPLASCTIELIQALFLAARFATVSDVVSNSIGAFIGIFAALIIRALVYRRDQVVISRALWFDARARQAVR